jgi:hypothetical protein
MIQRREFLKRALAAIAAADVSAQSNSLWGGPVLDTHLHLRPYPDACFVHMQGCGVTNAVLLTRAPDEDKASEEIVRRPGVFVRSVSADPAQRDTAFARDFIVRHRSKLIFGSDCACADGKGAGISQGNNPEAARLAGKCVARETLALLKGLTSPEIFRQITWENGTSLFNIPT